MIYLLDAKTEANSTVEAIVKGPGLGEAPKSDLLGALVYKYRSQQQLMLLADECDPGTRILLLGSHEDFYPRFNR